MNTKISFEVLSWLFAIIFAALFVLPIYVKCGTNYTFYIENIVSIILFVTLTRLLFLFSYTPYCRSKWLRMVLIFLPIPFLMYQIGNLYDFQKFVDEEGAISFFKDSFEISDYNFSRFIKYQFLFFCVSAIVTLVLLPVRMIISFWRTINTNDKV